MKHMSAYDMVVQFAEALGRQRALTDAESRMLEAAIRRQGQATWRAARKGPRPSVHHGTWGPASDDLLKRLLAAGKTTEEVARHMNRTTSAVRQRITLINKCDNQPMADRRYKRHEVGV